MTRPFKPAAEAPTGNTYVWVGPQNATWGAPADWVDTATGTVSTQAPHAGDSVVINGGLGGADVYGSGAAKLVTIDGLATLTGHYSFDTLLDTGTLALENGSTIVRTARANDLSLEHATLDVRGAMLAYGAINVGAYAAYAADLQVGRLTILTHGAIATSIFVDAYATLEVGHDGHAIAGALTVDQGATLAGAGEINSDVVDNGLIDVQGTLIMGPLAGTGIVRIEAHSLAGITSGGGGTTIDFAGQGGELEVEYNGTLDPTTTIAGFGLGDVIAIDNSTIVSVVRTFDGTNTMLSLDNAAGQVVQQLTLLGSQTSLDFELLAELDPGRLLLVAAPATPTNTVPAGTGGDHFVWTGTAGTAWGTPGNWRNVSQPGSVVAPGAHDTVTIAAGRIGFTLITGAGAAARVTLSGHAPDSAVVAFAGTFDFDSMIGGGFPGLTEALAIIGSGTLVRMADALSNTSSVSIVGGATLEAATVTSGRFTLSNQGVLIADQVMQNATISLDSTSAVDIGGTGGAAGCVTISSGGTGRNLVVDATIVDDGQLVYSEGTGENVASISGSGSLVLHGGTLEVTNSISGVTVAFEGYGELDLNPLSPFAVSGLRIADFGDSDTIEVGQSSEAESFLRYMPQGAGAGELDLVTAGGSTIDSFSLTGDYSTDRFLLSQTGLTDVITLLPSHVDHQIAPGTPNGGVFTLRATPGPLVWSDPASWLDGTGAAASVAPGAHDTAYLGTGTNSFVTGAAIVEALIIGESATLDGTFTAETVSTAGMLLAGAGSVLNAGTLIESIQDPFESPPPALTIDRSQVTIAVGDLIDATELRDGGFLDAASMSFADLQIDPTSRAVLGSAGAGIYSFTPGALTVEAGMTLQDIGQLQAGLVDDGIVDISGRTEVSGAVAGTGTLDVGSAGPGATLTVDGSVDSATRIDFAAGQSSLVFGQTSGPHGEVAGFTIGDTLVFANALDAAKAVFEPVGNDSAGTLVLEDQSHQAIATVNMLGNYTGAHFAVSESTNGATVTITSFHSA